ncbi:MSMEG_6728 family protein [Microbacterium sp. 10M-3C3]|uniref:MSMEG_6728 family protein n=1 Tax=Microbacterium sp. 10M-3C3 TaxID=2483401 RepID=UPI000F6363DE|nr:MSMEG_6728 family protein [Microbacterium sp. 10M-3C3]
MQTFLPYPSFAASARALDAPRLGKQRVETLQLIRAQTVPGHGWRHHPAAKMWAGHVPALVAYGLAMTDEWIQRGHADTVREKLLAYAPEVDGVDQHALDLPRWIGDEAFHRAHRSNLIRKDAAFYRPRFGDDVPDDLPYIWPAP